jgi:hypothetical protein
VLPYKNKNNNAKAHTHKNSYTFKLTEFMDKINWLNMTNTGQLVRRRNVHFDYIELERTE